MVPGHSQRRHRTHRPVHKRTGTVLEAPPRRPASRDPRRHPTHQVDQSHRLLSRRRSRRPGRRKDADLAPVLVARRRDLAIFYFNKRLQLISTFALAERVASSTSAEDNFNVPTVPASIIQVLVREMQHDARLVQLCEWVASVVAQPAEMMSYLPSQSQQRPGQGQEVPVGEPGWTEKSARMRDRRNESREEEFERELKMQAQEEARQGEQDGLFLTEEIEGGDDQW